MKRNKSNSAEMKEQLQSIKILDVVFVSAASSIKGINFSLAAGLPGKCGVSVPYKISPSTKCES
ncbi:Lipid transfer protein/Par allergen [Trema orientale]|uniref:Lipid transfer protein/Par allergen n=1 Tax=Trema orientale TaxID=63057 RepID=A0A2P5F4K7_TREOI|nr:Lipid transfer protein/Par allergen [Trema orientale]